MISDAQHQAMNRGWFGVFPALVALLAWNSWPPHTWFREVFVPAAGWTIAYQIYICVKFARLRLAQRQPGDRG